jgi:dolichyl-phosphate-mannose-protein mannosyltransferase
MDLSDYPNFSFRLAILIVLLASLLPSPVRAQSKSNRNLLLNGDFSKGSGDQPDEWRTEAWINKPDSFGTTWIHPEKGPYELKVNNLKPNDGRWQQSLSLTPGWYQLSADIRAEAVGPRETGASMSVMEDGIMSEEVRGPTFQHVSLFLRIGGTGADIDVALRVGGYGSLNTGRAFFRNARLVKIDSLPRDAQHVFDLAAIRQQEAPEPKGSPLSLVITFMLLAGTAWLGWRLYGEGRLFAPTPDDSVPRAERRRRR